MAPNWKVCQVCKKSLGIGLPCQQVNRSKANNSHFVKQIHYLHCSHWYIQYILITIIFISIFFLKKWSNPWSLFVYFRSFQTQFYIRNCKLQRDSNWIVGRRACWPLDHHHVPFYLHLKMFLLFGIFITLQIHEKRIVYLKAQECNEIWIYFCKFTHIRMLLSLQSFCVFSTFYLVQSSSFLP